MGVGTVGECRFYQKVEILVVMAGTDEGLITFTRRKEQSLSAVPFRAVSVNESRSGSRINAVVQPEAFDLNAFVAVHGCGHGARSVNFGPGPKALTRKSEKPVLTPGRPYRALPLMIKNLELEKLLIRTT